MKSNQKLIKKTINDVDNLFTLAHKADIIELKKEELLLVMSKLIRVLLSHNHNVNSSEELYTFVDKTNGVIIDDEHFYIKLSFIDYSDDSIIYKTNYYHKTTNLHLILNGKTNNII